MGGLLGCFVSGECYCLSVWGLVFVVCGVGLKIFVVLSGFVRVFGLTRLENSGC